MKPLPRSSAIKILLELLRGSDVNTHFSCMLLRDAASNFPSCALITFLYPEKQRSLVARPLGIKEENGTMIRLSSRLLGGPQHNLTGERLRLLCHQHADDVSHIIGLKHF